MAKKKPGEVPRELNIGGGVVTHSSLAWTAPHKTPQCSMTKFTAYNGDKNGCPGHSMGTHCYTLAELN